MSEVRVNTIVPRTTSNVEFQGLDVPTYLGSPLALDSEVVRKDGSTITGAVTMTGGANLVLNGNASAALQAVPKQQLDSSISTAIAGLGAVRSFTSNGYYEAPGGFIIQWASVAAADVSGTDSGTIIWPKAGGFPNACLKVIGGISSTGGVNHDLVLAIIGYDTTGCTYSVTEFTSSVNPCTIDVIAIGH